MLGLLARLVGGGEAAPAAPVPLPPGLLKGITYATIAARPGADPESGDARVLVQCHAIGGAFYWSGTRDAAERIARAWPEIGATGARKAAALLASNVAARVQADAQGQRRRRRGWVFDYLPDDMEH